MSRYHVSDGVVHVDVEDAADEDDALAQALERAPELTEGSVELSKSDPVYGKGAEAE